MHATAYGRVIRDVRQGASVTSTGAPNNTAGEISVTNRPLKRPLLYVLVGSVVAGALFGIFVILRGEWSWFEVQTILTTIVLAVASVCSLACDLARTPRGVNLLPNAGVGITLIAALLMLIGIWGTIEADEFWKLAIPATIFAVATVHVCLLSIARLARRFQWVYWIACQVIFGLAMLITLMIVGEFDDEEMFRFVAVLAIVDAALTLVIPLLHRISRTDADRAGLISPIEERTLVGIDNEIDDLRRRIVALEKLRTEIAGQPQEPV